MNHVTITQSTLTLNSFNVPNTIFLINEDINFNGNTYGLADNTILRFDGGSLGNGTLQASSGTVHAKIEGRGYIFKTDLIFGTGIELDEQELKAEWFGVMDSTDCTDAIQKAIDACYATLVRILSFNRGTFQITCVVHLGQATTGALDANHKYWSLQIRGAGNSEKGTCFSFFNHGRFIVNQINPDMGMHRGGGIYNCRFRTSHNTEGEIVRHRTAIHVKYAHTYTIYNCSFEGFKRAIKTEGRSYYMDIRSCKFCDCTTGILAVPDSVDTDVFSNENVVANCMFAQCPCPMDVSTGDGWHIMDTDFEGENGTVKLSRGGRMTNVRMERNDQNVPWLEIGDNCVVDAKMLQTDTVANGDSQNSTPTWRCIVNGNNNILHLRLAGLTPYGLVSYGRGNKFDIVSENHNSASPMQFVFDPEDVFVLNGYSNKEDYRGTNLIKTVNGALYSDTASDMLKEYDEMYSQIFANMYEPSRYKEIYKTLYKPITSNATLTLITSVCGNIYKTCDFSMKDNGTTVPLFEGFTMNYQKEKWYSYASAFTPDNPSAISSIALCNAQNYLLFIRDVVVSTIPLYKRPLLETIEENTFNQRQSDNLIHLQKTYMNHITTTFSLIPNHLQCYTNWLGKIFHYSNQSSKYICQNKVVKTSTNINGYAVNVNVTSSNKGAIYYLLMGLLNVDVEIYDVNGNHLFFQARRNSTSVNFTITVTDAMGMTFNTSNAAGTIVINETPQVVFPWVTEA